MGDDVGHMTTHVLASYCTALTSNACNTTHKDLAQGTGPSLSFLSKSS